MSFHAWRAVAAVVVAAALGAVVVPAPARATTFSTTALSVGASVYQVAVSPNGQYVYAAATGSNEIVTLDTTSLPYSTNRVSAGMTPTGVAFIPDSSRAYVSMTGMNAVFAYATSTGMSMGPTMVNNMPKGVTAGCQADPR
ncbi:YncE family protein [Dactylosporangium cerinum]|uniref:YncE family protein n=1 Tax=Dactylosporangium cerinum TaxID=1434730 RepID=A0ABV9WL24_9ACTN